MPIAVRYNGELVSRVYLMLHDGTDTIVYDTNTEDANKDVLVNNTLTALDIMILKNSPDGKYDGKEIKELKTIGFRQYLSTNQFISIRAIGV